MTDAKADATEPNAMADVVAVPDLPQVGKITSADVFEALRAGLTDFQRAPLYGLFFGLVFSLAGIAIVVALLQGEVSFWILPAAAGFPLIGPFAAVGLYEVSRRLEAGEPLSWGAVLSSGFTSRSGQLPFFAVLAIFIFLAWIVIARVVFAISFGTAPMTNIMSSFAVFFTFQGILMLLVGSVIGAALAFLLFSISVVGVPLLVDRDIDIVTAMIASFKATLENRQAMFTWAIIVAAGVIVAVLPLFLGMILVFPALGHSTWHLYRKVVEADA